MSTTLITNGTLLTMGNGNSIVTGDLLIENDRIAAIGDTAQHADTIIDASDCVVLPGFIQTHIHLCQTLFRGSADDLSLIDWLKTRVWPMEAAHTPESIAASARLGIAEMIKGGTTAALTMETVNHTEEVFKVVEESGFRATVGKCMMDKGDEVPSPLREETSKSIDESLALLKAWNGRADGRIRYCFAPRFAVSCTRELLERVAQLAHEHGVMIHTHASENLSECGLVESETGLRNVAYLNSLGVRGPHVALAHCVHLSDEEIQLLRTARTNVVHCPSSNMKLGSGIARVTELLRQNVSVSLGADGAACNNRLDMFTEMRLAALLQKAVKGPEALDAWTVLRMATIGGATALGMSDLIGTLEVGKKADVIVVRLKRLHTVPHVDLVSTLVYSAQPADVETVIIDGRVVMRARKLLTVNEEEIVEEADRQRDQLLMRVSDTA